MELNEVEVGSDRCQAYLVNWIYGTEPRKKGDRTPTQNKHNMRAITVRMRFKGQRQNVETNKLGMRMGCPA